MAATVTALHGTRTAASRGRTVPAGRLVLTRRGRIVVRSLAGFAMVAALLAGVLLSGRQAGAQVHPVSVSLSYRIVLPGETLWQIAGEVAPERDPRDVVDELVELNHLRSSGVVSGQRLVIPAY